MDVIRTLKYEELDDSLRLSAFAFQYELSGHDLEQKKLQLKPENIWGYFTEGRLAAKMTILPLRTFVQGKSLAMGGIASVATWPEYRRKGMVGRLLHHALEVMKQRGQTISFLHPFAFGFYRKFGWETYVDTKKYTVETGQLPKLDEVEGTVARTGKDYRLYHKIYETFAHKYAGMLVRDEEWWNNNVFKHKKDQSAIYYNIDGEPRGYILYQVKNNEMTVHELVFLDEKARQGLWKFINNHDSMFNKVILNAPVDDQLAYLLDNPRIKQEITPYFMARIVDAASFLEQYPFLPAAEGQTFTLRIEDRQAAWNNAIFEVRIHHGRASVSVVPCDEAGAAEVAEYARDTQVVDHLEGLLSCSIQTLTAMMLCYQRPEFLHRAGRLTGDEATVKRWQQAIPFQTPYLADYF
jgi:predicted acetyltransferase